MEKLTEFYNGKKVLITGGTGYLGSLLEKKLKQLNCKIIKTTSSELKQDKVNNIYYVDYTDKKSLEKLLKDVEVVFHLAAQTSAYKSEDEPVFDLNVNVIPLINLVDAVKSIGNIPYFVFASTATVYGMQNEKKISETNKTSPTTIYDVNKLVGEQYVKFFSKKGYIKGCSLRLSNVYGPGLTESSSDRGVINKMVKIAITGAPLSVYGDGDFIRDYIYNDDVVMAFLYGAAFASNQDGDYFNVCSGSGNTFKEVINLIISHVSNTNGVKSDINFVDFPDGALDIEKRNFVGNWEKLKNASGWCPKVDLKTGIKKSIRSYL